MRPKEKRRFTSERAKYTPTTPGPNIRLRTRVYVVIRSVCYISRLLRSASRSLLLFFPISRYRFVYR